MQWSSPGVEAKLLTVGGIWMGQSQEKVLAPKKQNCKQSRFEGKLGDV